ncbi:MAG: L-lactate dehydrogenase [Sphingomonadales bacterium]|nr:L-lactate dehydrogenase [Sphingomonadales bacterium]
MKASIVGMGTVGRAAALATMQRGSTAELVLVNRHAELAQAVALDLSYGAPVSATCTVRAGGYADLSGAGIIVIAAGVNERSGGATDRSDPAGRLRLLQQNSDVLRAIVPPVVAAAPDSVILIATDPPDALTDAARELAPNANVLSTGTWLDSLRLRTHLANAFGINPRSVEADVLGEHGTSEVLHWSGATVAGVPWADLAAQRGIDPQGLRQRIENEVRFANINIIDVLGASQYGIGIVIARIIEAVLRDEKLVVPIGSYHAAHGVTYSLPSVLGAQGVEAVLTPRLDPQEQDALARSIATLQQARAKTPMGSPGAAVEQPADIVAN